MASPPITPSKHQPHDQSPIELSCKSPRLDLTTEARIVVKADSGDAVSTPSRNSSHTTESRTLTNRTDSTETSDTEPPFSKKHAKASCFLPLALVLIISLLPSSVLLGLCYGREVQTDPPLFPSNDLSGRVKHAYILVNYSATKLLIFSSWLSTLAPFLTGSIARLFHIRTARAAKRAAARHVNRHGQPPPDHFSLVATFRNGSYDGLLKYILHLFSKKRREGKHQLPSYVNMAAFIVTINILLVLAMFSADNVLHALTNGVNFSKISVASKPSQSLGHRLTDLCVDFDRTPNYCYPCTLDWNSSQPIQLEVERNQNEVFRLQTASSQDTFIMHWSTPLLESSSLAVLLPKASRLPSGIEYRARTLGVSTQCHTITPQCHPRSTGDQGIETQFNCTDKFYGLLGKAPISSNIIQFKAPDPDVPPLCFKESASLQYCFFTDSSLTQPYNPVLYDAQTGNERTSAAYCPLDTQLLNPVYVGVAGRFNRADELAGGSLHDDPLVFNGEPDTHEFDRLVDFVLSCAYTTYDVEYVWGISGLQSFTFAPNNGSVAEMYQGQLTYVGEGAHNPLTINILHAALTNDSDAMARIWGDLYSDRVLSVIGGYTTPDLNAEEQFRSEVMVAQVHKGALWFVVGLSWATGLLAAVLAGLGWCAVSEDPGVWRTATEMSWEGRGEKDGMMWATEAAGPSSMAVDEESGGLEENGEVEQGEGGGEDVIVSENSMHSEGPPLPPESEKSRAHLFQ